MTSTIKVTRVLEIHPESRHVLVLPEEGYDEDVLNHVGDVISDWWHGRDEQNPILILPPDMRLELVRK